MARQFKAPREGNYDKPIPDTVVQVGEAALATEQFHLDYLKSAGAKPLAQSFAVPDPALLTRTDTLFTTIIALETAFISAYTAAMAEFANLKQPDLVKVAFQIGAIEAEHRVLANYAVGTRPANDVAFEAKQFATAGDAAAALKQLGCIRGSGTAASYPGPVDSSQFNNLLTETTPGGPSVSCTPMTMPNTGAGTTASGRGNMYELLALFGVSGGALVALSSRLTRRAGERPEC